MGSVGRVRPVRLDLREPPAKREQLDKRGMLERTGLVVRPGRTVIVAKQGPLGNTARLGSVDWEG